jgi:DNA/RNA endonuclease YhcR with UshA esterase domain
MVRPALCLCWLLLSTSVVVAQRQLTSSEAVQHIGESATVCGQVVSVHFSAHSKGEPTFLNLDRPYPSQVFTVLVWGEDRPKFGDLDAKFSNERVCVRGTISAYRGEPEIVVHDPSNLVVKL